MGVIDVFGLKPADEQPLYEALRGYDDVVTLEEGFIKRGGLDAMIGRLLADNGSRAKLTRLGVDDHYLFDLGGREQLHRLCGMDEEGVLAISHFPECRRSIIVIRLQTLYRELGGQAVDSVDLNWPLMKNNITRADLRAVIRLLSEAEGDGGPILTQSKQVRTFEEEWSAVAGRQA